MCHSDATAGPALFVTPAEALVQPTLSGSRYGVRNQGRLPSEFGGSVYSPAAARDGLSPSGSLRGVRIQPRPPSQFRGVVDMARAPYDAPRRRAHSAGMSTNGSTPRKRRKRHCAIFHRFPCPVNAIRTFCPTYVLEGHARGSVQSHPSAGTGAKGGGAATRPGDAGVARVLAAP